MRNKTDEDILKELLISPYWNVNLSGHLSQVPSLALLISPYWNVNPNFYIREDFSSCF